MPEDLGRAGFHPHDGSDRGFLFSVAAPAFAPFALSEPLLPARVVGLSTLLFGSVLRILGTRAFRAHSPRPRRSFAFLRADDAFLS